MPKMRILLNFYCDGLDDVTLFFKSWCDVRDYLVNLINNEIVYQWSAPIDSLEGRLEENNLPNGLFRVHYNTEMEINKEKLACSEDLIHQIERIQDTFYDTTCTWWEVVDFRIISNN